MSETVLGPIGVHTDEELVYRALLQNPRLNVAALQQRVSMSASRVRRTLDGLERKAMVTRRSGAPVTYQPTPPDIVIDTLVAQREDELRQVRLDSSALVDLHRQPSEQAQAADLVEILTTPDAVNERWLQLQSSTRHCLEVLVRPPFGQGRITDDEDVQQTLLDRDILTRGVYDQQALQSVGVLGHIRTMTELGEQARVVSNLPVKLALIDRRAALIPLTQPDPSGAIQAGLVVHESALLDSLLSLFDLMWSHGSPVRFSDEPDTRRSQEDAVMTLLASGLKDDAIARQLGVSTNTVRRRISGVLTRLGATTRFQAGLALANEGWLDSEQHAR